MADPHPSQPRRRPAPIEHTCEPGSDRQRCACSKARQAAQLRERRRNDPRYANAVLDNNFRRLYGITRDEYEQLRAAQDHRCAICRRHEDELPVHAGSRKPKDGGPPRDARPLKVDHRHGGDRAVRGLLCHDCNLALGGLRDDPELFEAAAAFVALAGQERTA